MKDAVRTIAASTWPIDQKDLAVVRDDDGNMRSLTKQEVREIIRYRKREDKRVAFEAERARIQRENRRAARLAADRKECIERVDAATARLSEAMRHAAESVSKFHDAYYNAPFP